MSTEETGCEDYLYRETLCCLHPCRVQDCPEPICGAIDFPGGINAYLRYRKICDVLARGLDIYQAAAELNISYFTAIALFKKRVHINASQPKSNQTQKVQVTRSHCDQERSPEGNQSISKVGSGQA